MESKLEVGGTLRQVFSIYGDQAGVLLPVAFCLFLVVGVVEWVVAGTLLLFFLALAANIVAGTLYQGMVVGLVRDVQDGRRDSSVEELMKSATPVILPLIGVGLLAGLAIGFGFFLLVVPGLILMTIWAVVAPVIVVERTGVMASFGRSRELVRGNGWPVFGVILSVVAIVFAAGFALGFLGVLISDSAVALIVANVIAAAATAPISALVASVIYFRLLAMEKTQAELPPAEGVPAPL